MPSLRVSFDDWNICIDFSSDATVMSYTVLLLPLTVMVHALFFKASPTSRAYIDRHCRYWERERERETERERERESKSNRRSAKLAFPLSTRAYAVLCILLCWSLVNVCVYIRCICYVNSYTSWSFSIDRFIIFFFTYDLLCKRFQVIYASAHKLCKLVSYTLSYIARFFARLQESDDKSALFLRFIWLSTRSIFIEKLMSVDFCVCGCEACSRQTSIISNSRERKRESVFTLELIIHEW